MLIKINCYIFFFFFFFFWSLITLMLMFLFFFSVFMFTVILSFLSFYQLFCLRFETNQFRCELLTRTKATMRKSEPIIEGTREVSQFLNLRIPILITIIFKYLKSCYLKNKLICLKSS